MKPGIAICQGARFLPYNLAHVEFITQGVPAGCMAHPTGAWVTQQARQSTWILHDKHAEQDKPKEIRFLIHDRDAKFTAFSDSVFESERIEVIRTPYRSPKAKE